MKFSTELHYSFVKGKKASFVLVHPLLVFLFKYSVFSHFDDPSVHLALYNYAVISKSNYTIISDSKNNER